MTIERRATAILAGEAPGAISAMWRLVAWPLALSYGAIIAARDAAFAAGIKRQHRLPVPVISIGNLSAGGTGKTPAVVFAVRELQHVLAANGQTVAILSRGYRPIPGTSHNDEGLELAAKLPGVRHEQQRDRFAAACRALADDPRIGAFVLDDGFSHRRLARDFDVVLIDASRPFGGGELLPRGLFREPPGNLARAQAVVLTRADQVPGETLDKLRQRVRRFVRPDVPVAVATHRPIGWRPVFGKSPASPEIATGAKVVAMCGIAHPTAFVHTLAAMNVAVVDTFFFADHHAFSLGELRAVAQAAKVAGAAAIVTTAKDAGRIRAAVGGAGGDGIGEVPWLVAEIAFDLRADADAAALVAGLRAAVNPAMQRATSQPLSANPG